MYSYLETVLILKEVGGEEVDNLICQMLEKLPEEMVYSTDDNGKKVIDFEKIGNEFKKINEGRAFDYEFKLKTFNDTAIDMIKNPNIMLQDIGELIEESRIEGEKRMLSQKYTNLEEILSNPDISSKTREIAIAEFNSICAKFPDASLRLAEETAEGQMEQGTLNEQAFSVLTNATLDSLIKAQDGDYFVDDKYTKKSKKNLFKKIIDEGINGKKTIDQELLSKMVKADSQIMSNILLELIGKQNENLSTNLVLGQYIQEIGQTVKSIAEAKSEPTISASKVEIDQIVEQFGDKSDGIFKGETTIKKDDLTIRSDDDDER